MPDNRYQEFKGCLPYASELFGVYRPLLGWKGKQAKKRVCTEQLALAEHVIKGMLNDPRVRGLIQGEVKILGPDIQLPPRIPDWLNSVPAKQVQIEVEEFIRTNQRVPTKGDWGNILHTANARVHETLNVRSSETPSAVALMASPQLQPQTSPLYESVTFGTLDYLQQHAPEVLQAVFVESQKSWGVTANFINPLSNFHTDIQDAVLSPIGMIFLYREYFFELNSFLGPPVEHIWISPGGSVELFEVHTRREVVERLTEAATEVTSRTEVTTTTQEELSDAIKQENQENEKLGTSVSGGANFVGVWHAEGSITFDFDQTHSTAEETSHKVLRQQSEKLSNEIRRNFKTTFKTTLETEDTFSRRYVIQNTTDKLVNYELRRKMRQVGVQVQHIGTQLCWKAYIDDPGYDLAIAELVHVAKPEDVSPNIQPPEAPTPLQPKSEKFTFEFAFQQTKGNEREGQYVRGVHNGDEIIWQKVVTAPLPGLGYYLHDVIEDRYERTDPNNEPPEVSATYDTSADDPSLGPDQFRINFDTVAFKDQPSIRFFITLIWNPPPISDEQRKAYEQQLAEYHERERREAHAQYVQAVRERIKLGSGIRKRDEKDLRDEERAAVSGRLIRQLMQIAPNETADMTHVMSELIQQIFEVDKLLYFVAEYWWKPRPLGRPQSPPPRFDLSSAGSTPGRAVELRPGEGDQGDKGITDRGRGGGGDDEGTGSGGGVAGGGRAGGGGGPSPGRNTDSALTQSTRLTEDDVVGWGGVAPGHRAHYLITEDSTPAPMGASLGWLLQLDGDNHRNAFLNSPWVEVVLPIRPGKEMDALAWLQQAHIEGTDGLDQRLNGGPTLMEQIRNLAQQIAALNADPLASIHTEAVFETGFNPLEGGFRAPGTTAQLPPDGRPVPPGTPYGIFDQWAEILPTNQVVAVEYHPEEHEGCGER